MNSAPVRIEAVTEFWAPREYRGKLPPAWLIERINLRGGFNRFGEPMYRLVWAPDRLSPVGGTFKDWPEGTSLDERLRGTAKPIRTVVDVRLRPRYPSAGATWALERWIAPEQGYGSPERWYSPIYAGGTMLHVKHAHKMVPAIGAYPYRGDYEYTGFGYTNETLSEASVVGAIGAIERGIESLPPLAVRYVNSLNAAQAEEDLLAMQMEKLSKDILQEAMPAFNGNPMSGYGKKKRHSSITMAERAGIRSHPDAS